MKRPANLVLLLLWAALPSAQARTLTIAIIDTGIDRALPNLCKNGHVSYVSNSDPLEDNHGHGTHIAGLVNMNAGEGDYCLVAMKFYSDKNNGRENLANMVRAIQHAIDIKVDFINISGGGAEPDEIERSLIQRAINAGITVVVAAGNEGDNLDKGCNYFPACYDKRLVVVGNLKPVGDSFIKAESSNYGRVVTRWEIGWNVLSTLPGHRVGRMTGTSQATAVATGKLVRQRLGR